MTVSDNELIKVAEQRLDEYQDMGYSHARELVITAKRLLSANEKNERIIELNDKLIKTQSAEIEKLQKANEEAVSCFTRMESLYKIKCKELEVAKVEKVIHCSECKHLIVHNLPTLYASCIRCHLRFAPFQLDTRTHFCSLGERKENNDNPVKDYPPYLDRPKHKWGGFVHL